MEAEDAHYEEAPMEKSFDDMLAALPAFTPKPASARPPAAPPAPVANEASVASADEDAELLADVRAQFDAVAAEEDLELPPPAAMPEAEADDEVLELVDDVADDEDEDGWMSTLLEGRGDDRAK
jgi:hypothetical protein